jgi:HEPN domain-containing protein
VLIYLAIDFPFTHDLDRLREAIPAGWQVKEKFTHLYGLSIWAVESRYPGDLPDVVSADAEQALQLADALYQTVAEEHHTRLS